MADTYHPKMMTEFHGIPTKTCLALEPLPAEIADELTGALPLY